MSINDPDFPRAAERPVDAPRAPPCAARVPPQVIASDTLLGSRTQLAIRHRETIYYLRQTRSGKLILTK